MRLRFWKKEEPLEVEGEGPEEKEEFKELKEKEKQEAGAAGIWADLTRLRAKVESLDEIRKANAERFARLSEQIGELRGMILDTNRSVSEIEVKSTKTADLVQAVHPEQLMVEVRKVDGKIEAVRANIESNEAMMKTMIEQLKELRNRISFFRGLDQVMKLSDDVKKDLTEMQKTKAVIERHADKSETIFSEMQDRFTEIDQYSGKMKDLTTGVRQLNDAADTMKVQMVKRAEKKELEKLIKKFDEFEVHVGNVIDLMSRKAKDLNEQFKTNVKKFQVMFDTELQKGKKVLDLIENLSKQSPNFDKNLRILKEIEQKEEEEKVLEEITEGLPKADKKTWFSWIKKKPKEEKKEKEEVETAEKETPEA